MFRRCRHLANYAFSSIFRPRSHFGTACGGRNEDTSAARVDCHPRMALADADKISSRVNAGDHGDEVMM